MGCIKDLHPASWPAQTCNDSANVMISSFSCTTIALPLIHWIHQHHHHWLVSVQDICLIVSNDMLLNANASKEDDIFSAVRKFLFTWEIALRHSGVPSPSWVDINNLFQPSASSPDGPSTCFACSFFNTLCTDWGEFDWVLFFWFVNNTSPSALCLGGWFCFNCC